MSKIAHTPKPWKVGKPYGASRVEIEGPGQNGGTILVAVTDPRNAPLISAAPDLLAACQSALAELLRYDMNEFSIKPEKNDTPEVVALRAAIAKATT